MYLMTFGIKTKSRLSGPLEKHPSPWALFYGDSTRSGPQGPIDSYRCTTSHSWIQSQYISLEYRAHKKS